MPAATSMLGNVTGITVDGCDLATVTTSLAADGTELARGTSSADCAGTFTG